MFDNRQLHIRQGGSVPGKVLIIAYHFPPLMGSSGLLRALKYCRYLPESGWQPTVLTAHPRTYEKVDTLQLSEIPANTRVLRAFALDTRTHLSIRGRYSRYMSLPDRWSTWLLGALPSGLFEISRNKTDVIVTTFPIASAVLIGYLLHRITGIPWVADFRDSMTEDNYPRDPLTRRIYRWIEKKAVRHASRLIFTARSTLQMYLQRYPDLSPDKCVVISNGYDEKDFVALPEREGLTDRKLRILHSGLIYPEERNPVPLFKAVAALKKQGTIDAEWLTIDLRACGNEPQYRELAASLDIQDLVHFLPSIPYQQALQDANDADALLLMQGACCDHQIPAKAYEYLRLRTPILALTSNTGDTAALLNECGGCTLIDLEDEDAICRQLPAFLASVREGTHNLPDMQSVSKYSRQHQAAELARCLNEVTSDDGVRAVVQISPSSESGRQG